MVQFILIMNKLDRHIVESSISATACSQSIQIDLWAYAKQLLTNKVSLVESDLIAFINNESDENIFNIETHRFNENGTQENFYTTYKSKKILCCTLHKLCKIHRTKDKNSKVITIKPN